MREYNRTDAARSLLKEVSIWTVDTGTKETAIGHVLFLHPGFVGLLRKRLQVSEEKETIVRRFLLANPEGWSGTLPNTHSNGTKPRIMRYEKEYPDRPRVDRDPCPRCGVRRDIGCGHSLAPMGMVL